MSHRTWLVGIMIAMLGGIPLATAQSVTRLAGFEGPALPFQPDAVSHAGSAGSRRRVAAEPAAVAFHTAGPYQPDSRSLMV